MTDYILITSVTAEKLFGVFEESVRETCAKDYSAVQMVRTSMLKRLPNDSGVCTNNRSRSEMTPPI